MADTVTIEGPGVDWEAYRPFALKLAHRQAPSGIIDREDLEAVALTELWRAAQRYDPGRGVRFATFAHRSITGALLRARRDTSGVPAWAWEQGVRFDAISYETFADGEEGLDSDKAACLAVEDPDVVERVTLASALSHLSERQRRIVWAVAVEERTQSEAGAREGIGQVRASVIYRAGLAKLRALMG